MFLMLLGFLLISYINLIIKKNNFQIPKKIMNIKESLSITTALGIEDYMLQYCL
jgi:hypothetical protein